jgi:hypothetical protein
MTDRGILVIAPQSDVQGIGDLRAAANGFRLQVLDGMVTAREVLAQISSGRYAVVHFAGHGLRAGLQASDGVIEERYLELAMQEGGPELVVLNSCGSIHMAAQLYRAGAAPRVIGWRQEVEDGTAIEWATAFYRSLAMGTDYWEAFAASVELLSDRRPGFEAPILLNGRITSLEQRVEAIQERLDGRAIVPHWLLGLAVAAGALVAVALLVAVMV